MRILTVANVPADPNSGAGGTVYHTNVAFRDLGHQVDEIWADQLGPRRIGHGNLHSLLEQPRAYRREVLKSLGKQDYDAIMISQPQGYLAAKALKQAGFSGAVINRSHGLELRVDAVLPQWYRRLGIPESRRPWLTPAIRHFLQRQWTQAVRYFDGIVTPSSDDCEFLKRVYRLSTDRVVTIHHGVPDEYLQKAVAPMTEDRRRRLLYVGQHAFIKGPDILVAVLNELLPEHPQLTMTWVTSEQAHSKIRQQLSAEIRPRVALRNWLPQQDLLSLYDDHGIFVFPSFFEGAGKACAEAMSRGLHVVATETGGMKDHLRAVGGRGLCAAGDVQAFVDAILLIVTAEPAGLPDPSVYAEYMKGKSWSHCANELVHYFDQQVTAKRARQS